MSAAKDAEHRTGEAAVGRSTTMRDELRKLLNDLFVARATGATQAKMARAHGYVDGYMRALIENGVASRSELLRLVAEERARVDGPAIRQVSYPEPAEAVL